MLIHRLLLLTVMLFSASIAFSQAGTKYIVFGRISDQDGNPVAGAHIQELQSQVVAVSGRDGLYEMTIGASPAVLQYSFVGYSTVRDSLSADELKQSSTGRIQHDVFLIPSSEELQVVEITDSPYDLVYNNPDAWVNDFCFLSENEILLFLKEKNKSFLRVINTAGTLQHELQIPFSASELYSDCFGNAHLVGQDSSWQVYVSDETGLVLYPAIPVRMLKSQLQPCVYVNDAYLYVRYMTAYNQSAAFVQINKISKAKKLIQTVADTAGVEKIKALLGDMQQAAETQASKKSRGSAFQEAAPVMSPGVVRSNTQVAELGYDPFAGFEDPFYPVSNEMFELYSWFNFSVSHEVRAYLYSVSNSVYVFDLVKNDITRYNGSGQAVHMVTIDEAVPDLDESTLMQDFGKQHVFLLRTQHGLANVRIIDPELGTAGAEYKISLHIFPQKLKILNNDVYYLYGGQINNAKKSLYRQHLY